MVQGQKQEDHLEAVAISMQKLMVVGSRVVVVRSGQTLMYCLSTMINIWMN